MRQSLSYAIILYLNLLLSHSIQAQLASLPPMHSLSQLGYSGLIYTPSAYTSNWASWSIGATHYDKNAAFSYEAGESNERSFWTTIGFLPQGELTVKLTKPYNSGDKNYGIGDRSFAFRLQLLAEKKYLPALLIGVHDPFSIRTFFNTNYVVMSKTFKKESWQILSNLGYGFKIEEAEGHHLLGVFGGIQATWKDLQITAEYDADNMNIGMAYQYKKRLGINLSLIDLQYFSGSIFFRFQLAQ